MLSFKVPKQTALSKFGDILMLPIMYILQFPSLEMPQRTHYWNNDKYPSSSIMHFSANQMVSVESDSDSVRRWWGPLPIFHMPIMGGWKKFVVVKPVVQQNEWYVGWIAGDTMGISQITLNSSVRLLKGPTSVFFFGINENGDQIDLCLEGEGSLGTAHSFRKTVLL